MRTKVRRLVRRPGSAERVSGALAVVAIIVMGLLEGDTDAEQWPYVIAAFLVAILTELVVLRRHADARWDAAHGPIWETLRVRGKGFDPEVQLGAVVTFAGREFRVDQVDHCMERGEGMRTDFEATRGGEG